MRGTLDEAERGRRLIEELAGGCSNRGRPGRLGVSQSPAAWRGSSTMPDPIEEPAVPASDRSLLAQFKGGQPDAFTEIYLRYARRLQDLAAAQTSAELARRTEPEEIVQSVFRTFFRRASEGYYDVPAGEDLWKLLLVMALNKIRTAAAYHRAAKRDIRQTSGGEAFEHALDRQAAADETSLATLKLVVDEVLETLPESHRKMIELRFEGYEVAEIAERVERSKRSVERVLQDVRKRLADHIGEGF